MKNALQTKNQNKKLEIINQVPEELLWINNFNSKRSRQTYQIATKKFIDFFKIKTAEELRTITHAHIIAFKNHLQESEQSPKTINNRLSALSSLFNHLIEHQVVFINPVQSVKRMRINSNRVEAKVLSPRQARRMINAPDLLKGQGIRDRAILGTLFFTGCRVSELCKLKVKDYYEEQGFWILDFVTKGGKRNRLAVNQELQVFLNAYLEQSGHNDEKDSPLILPIKMNPNLNQVRFISSRQVQLLWKRYAEKNQIQGTTPHSARATFITQALENNCPLDTVQKSVGHSQIKTTQMYDKRVAKYRESASFAVRY
jgi:integrase/recombinase XerD